MDSTISIAKVQNDEVTDCTLLLDANNKFNNTDYDKCLELLHRLEIKSECNSQILRHNLAVVAFYNSNCMDYATLLKKLRDIELDVAQSDKTMPSLSLKTTSNFIAQYNKAVIYFHRHMYCTALATLEPLIACLETMDKKICLMVATLYLQLIVSTNQITKAAEFLDYLQKELNLSDTRTKSNSLPAEESNHNSQNLIERAECNLQLLHMMIKVLNRKPVKFPDDGNPRMAAVKAHQYYIMKDFQMAAKQLIRINNECSRIDSTSELNTCIANNMGVIHLRVRHYAIAAKFFQNAIAFDKCIVKSLHNDSLETISTAHSCEILYNLAISFLHLRRPKEAFQCFLLPMKLYHSNPRLWLRVSEACIMEYEAHEEKQASLHNISSNPQNIYSTQSSAVPEPTLEFGVLCLRNALTLTQYYKNNFHKVFTNAINADKKLKNWKKIIDNSFCNPSQPVTIESLNNMLSAIYAAYSFISLRLGDHVTALEMAQELLKSHSLSDAHKLLGHMYAGEALMMINKGVDARLHLDPTFVSSLNAFDFETRDWQVKSLEAAQNVVRYNLAVALVLQSEYDAAKTLVASLTHPLVMTKAIMVRQYIDFKLGFNAPVMSMTNNF